MRQVFRAALQFSQSASSMCFQVRSSKSESPSTCPYFLESSDRIPYQAIKQPCRASMSQTGGRHAIEERWVQKKSRTKEVQVLPELNGKILKKIHSAFLRTYEIPTNRTLIEPLQNPKTPMQNLSSGPDLGRHGLQRRCQRRHQRCRRAGGAPKGLQCTMYCRALTARLDHVSATQGHGPSARGIPDSSAAWFLCVGSCTDKGLPSIGGAARG